MRSAVKFVPGCYALRVRGELSSEHQVTLQEKGAVSTALLLHLCREYACVAIMPEP